MLREEQTDVHVFPGSVSTLEGANAFVDEIMQDARSIYEMDGLLTNVFFIGMQINPMNGEPFNDIQILLLSPQQLGIDPNDKQRYTDAIRMISKMTKAIMVVTVMEAWMLHTEDRSLLERHRSLEHVPGREECVQVMMEHDKLGTKVQFWTALITRDENGRGILAEFKGPTIMDRVEGRFIGFVTPTS